MTFDRFIGMTMGPDDDSASIVMEDHHRNPTGNVNGGVLVSLADNLSTGTASRAYFAKTGERKFLVGVDLHAVMLANRQGGTIRAIARPVPVGRRVTVIRTEVRGDGDLLLAEVTTTHVPT
jgi:uncharacterized protein (TIGR00369 family)